MKSLPNILTYLRIAVIPVVVASFYMEGSMAHWVGAILFSLASITDYFDGYLARAMKAESQIGVFLDPIADKLIVAATIIMLVHFDRAGVIPAIIIISREILVSGLREYLGKINISVPVSRLAKYKTAIQMIAIIILMVGVGGSGEVATRYIGDFMLWIAAILTVITGYSYLKSGISHMSD